MIYWALTPVANISGEGTGRPTQRVDNVHQVTFTALIKWIAFPLFLTFDFCSIFGLCLANVKFSFAEEGRLRFIKILYR